MNALVAAEAHAGGRQASALDVHHFRAFGGALCSVLAVGPDLEAVSQVVAEVYAFEARLTRFDARSELSRFNACAGPTTPVSPLLEALLRAALAAAELSDGIVNAAVLPALVAAGYDRTIELVRARDHGADAARATVPVPPPPLAEVLEVGRGWARLRRGNAVDLGGVGKGWLADRLAERLTNAVVNLGGDLRALGDGPEGLGWTIGLCNGGSVAVRDAGAATSGVGGRRWRGGHHLIDPRTGRPAATDVAAVSVVAIDALRAEVLAKGVAILGSTKGPPWAQARGAAIVRVLCTPTLPIPAETSGPA
ncbi:MAG TPA: FAD:protein FMN transferase [Candidatus Dormibacteraeota bacterium]